jgi:hypothetical protein
MRRRLRGLTTRVVGPAPTAPAETAPANVADAPEPPISENDDVTPALEAPVADVDAVLGAALDLAREVLTEVAEGSMGDYLGAETDDDLVVTHSFATTDKAYVGWRWAVTLTRAEGSDDVTVDEVVLLPGSGALVAPAWVPWSERVQPGDLAPGDLLPTAPDDPRLVAAYTETEVDLAAETFWELGLGRSRVLSEEGRAFTADRWYDGDQGPSSPMARQAPGRCLDCAFRIPLAGGLKSLFGVCANAFAPDDGKVVSLDHGCGAHSEVVVEAAAPVSGEGMVVEDEELEMIAAGPSPDDETPDGHAS